MKTFVKPLLLCLIFSLLSFTSYKDGYKVGDYVKDFRLKNVDGTMVSLKDKKTKGYILIFTCNHCPYSKLYEDRIIALDQKYASEGYPVIAINPNDPERQPEDSFEEMQKRAEAKEYTFPYLVDETQEVARRFGATKTPEVYLLKREGDKYKIMYIGAIDNNHRDADKANKKYVENALRDIEKGREVDEEHIKAIGCTIKWKNA
jgi:peroxiredoxin